MEWRKVGWRSPSNIAFVKYWGKHGNQLPSNPSLSMSLSECFSETSVTYSYDASLEHFELTFTYKGVENKAFAQRISEYLTNISRDYSFINKLHLNIDSWNSFPHSSGIASSASSMSSLALCLGSVAVEQGIWKDDTKDFFDRCSVLARLASGSASRSVFGGFVQWGFLKERSEMTDDHAVRVTGVHRNFQNLHDAILVISSQSKQRGSSQGHALMEAHPFAEARFKQAGNNLHRLHHALSEGNFDEMADIVENEALTLHALMMSSNPGYIELLPNSLLAIQKIRSFRESTGTPITFTIDAGPNIHVLYPLVARDEVLNFILNELEELCEDGRWIDDKIGNGPLRLNV